MGGGGSKSRPVTSEPPACDKSPVLIQDHEEPSNGTARSPSPRGGVEPRGTPQTVENSRQNTGISETRATNVSALEGENLVRQPFSTPPKSSNFSQPANFSQPTGFSQPTNFSQPTTFGQSIRSPLKSSSTDSYPGQPARTPLKFDQNNISNQKPPSSAQFDKSVNFYSQPRDKTGYWYN